MHATPDQLARTHARVALLRDTTRDLLAEDFALVGHTVPAVETFAQRCERAAEQITREEPQNSFLF